MGAGQEEMPHKKAKIIPESIAANMTKQTPEKAPAWEGDGDITIECGGCDTILAKNLQPFFRLGGIAIKCPNCGVFNEF